MVLQGQKQTAARVPKLLASLPLFLLWMRSYAARSSSATPSAPPPSPAPAAKGISNGFSTSTIPAPRTASSLSIPNRSRTCAGNLQNLERVRQALEQSCELNQQALREERDQLRSADHA